MIEAGSKFFSKVSQVTVPDDLSNAISKYKLKIDVSDFEKQYTIEDAAQEYIRWVGDNDEISSGERPYNKLDCEGNVYRLVHMGWPNKKKAPDEYFKPIIHPTTGRTCPTPDRGWRFPPNTIKEMLGEGPPVFEPLGYIRCGEIVFGPDERTQPQRKYMLRDHGSENLPSIVRFGGSDDEFLSSIGIEFQNAKPHKFISELLRCFSCAEDLVLDSFAGSGTMGHSVMMANRSDSGTRRFILVQMDEGEGKANADTLTAERIRRVMAGVKGVDSDSVGLGGAFTFYTLGAPVELEKVLSGETLPPYAGLGAAFFHMATNRALDPSAVREADFYLGATEGQHVWLIYKPDLEWLKTPEAALTLSRAKAFAATDPDKRHLVFAPARYVSQKMLAEQNIPVEFVPLPFALYRIDRS